MKKRIICLAILSLILTNTSAYAFSDIAAKDWFYKDVTALHNHGIVSGYDDNTFKPYSNVTNGEALKMVFGVAGIHAEPLKTGNHWASSYLNSAKILGILPETASEERLNNFITRQALADMVVNSMKLDRENIQIKPNTFKDTDNKNVNILTTIGIINGIIESDGLYFKPNNLITRAEISATLIRALHYKLGLHEVLSEDDISFGEQPLSQASLEKLFLYMASSGEFTYTVRYPTKGTQYLLSPEFRKTISEAFSNAFSFFPEFFSFTNSLNYTIQGTDNSATITFILGNSFFETEELATIHEAFLQGTVAVVVNLIQNQKITKDMGDREKARVLFDWIAKNTTYDTQLAAESYTGYGLIANGTAVCQGYTAAYNYMCRLVGLKVQGIAGSAGEDHIWTLAEIDGELVHIDVTWGDREHYSPNYDYFCATSDFMRRTHKWDWALYGV